MFDILIRTEAIVSTVRAMGAMIDEAAFVITPDGIAVRAVDPANASMVALDIPKDVFTKYDATEGQLGIDLARFLEILGMAKKGEDVRLELDPDTHRLDISMSGLSYTLSLLDPSTLRKSPQLPELDLPAEIIILSTEFKRMVKAAGMVGDSMSVGVQGETFFMEAEGNGDSVRIDMSGSELIKIRPADVVGTYSLDYMDGISKGIGSSGEVIISIGRDLPIVIDFVPYAGCSMTYVLAPRIDPV